MVRGREMVPDTILPRRGTGGIQVARGNPEDGNEAMMPYGKADQDGPPARVAMPWAPRLVVPR